MMWGVAPHRIDPLLGARGSEETIVQRLIRTPTGDWKLMVAPAVCEYVLAAPNVRVKRIVWSIEKLRTALMPSMVVTGAPLDLSDAGIKDGVIAGSKGVLSADHRGELEHLEVRRLFARPRERGPPQGSKTREPASSSTNKDESSSPSDPRPTRSVRIFAPPVIIDPFLQEGYLSIRWSVHPVRPYTPTQYYCKLCQRMGSHSTKYHRGGGASKGGANNP